MTYTHIELRCLKNYSLAKLTRPSLGAIGYSLAYFRTIFYHRGIFGFLNVLFSILFHLPPLMLEDAEIEPRIVKTSALAVRRSNHSARSHRHFVPQQNDQKT
jgi:hypothetical protein